MKKIFISTILAVAAVSGFIGYRANINNSESLSDLALTNIEALSYTEWGHDSGCAGPGNGCLLHDSDWHPDLKGDYPY